jgi:hypothetical protein
MLQERFQVLNSSSNVNKYIYYMHYCMKLWGRWGWWWMQGTFLTLAPDERLSILVLQIKMPYTVYK